jgi:hypothetical protein
MLNISTGSRHVFPRVSYYFNTIASTHSGKVQIRQLKVERKFLATPVIVFYLRSNGRGSGFKKYESLGKQTTQDTYYDRNGLLFSKGWVWACQSQRDINQITMRLQPSEPRWRLQFLGQYYLGNKTLWP